MRYFNLLVLIEAQKYHSERSRQYLLFSFRTEKAASCSPGDQENGKRLFHLRHHCCGVQGVLGLK
jgi:hypothetical protein